jgi:hypothetical protein
VNAREQMFSDVIITAVEGGTGYWAVASGYHFDGEDRHPASVTLTEQGAHVGYPVTVHGIAAAMYRIAHDRTVKVREDIRQDVGAALWSPDAADLDADDADAIVQVLIFGELVYG